VKPVHIDRAIVGWLAAALVVWCCCLVILWSWALDTSGGSDLITVAAGLLAISVASVLPGRAVRATRRVLSWLKVSGSIAIALASGGPKRSRPAEAKAMMRLLASVSIAAFCCGVVSTAAVFAAPAVMKKLAVELALDYPGWTLVRLVVQFAGTFPMAVGIVLTFLASAMVRAGSGRDVYASVFRQWLWAGAIGLGVFAACCRIGLNVVALSALAGVAILAAATLIFQRQGVTVRPGAIRKPLETPGAGRRFAVASTYAAGAVAGVCQLRLMTDVLAIGLTGRLCWTAATVGLLAWFLSRFDRKSRPPGQAQLIGAIIGVPSGLLLQAALVIAPGADGALAAFCRGLAVLTQIPLAALVAVIISRQRRLFAYAGGRAKDYLSSASGGVALGIVGMVMVICLSALLPAFPNAAAVLLVLALGTCAAGIIGGVVRTEMPRGQLRWTCTGAALMFSLAAATLPAMRPDLWRTGGVRFGVWLTRAAAGHSPRGPVSVLPGRAPRRSREIDELAREIMTAKPGRWLAVVVCAEDLPPRPLAALPPTLLPADPTAVAVATFSSGDKAGRWQRVGAERIRRSAFDGVYVHSLPTWHPDAWRSYNRRALERVVLAAGRDGPAVLRLQARDGSLPTALSAVKTFEQIAGPCRLFVKPLRDGVDMLAVAQRPSSLRMPATADMASVSGRRLWYEWPAIKPMEMLNVTTRQPDGPSIRQFISRLEAVRRYEAGS